MPIPDFQTMMLPILRLSEDGQTRTHADALAALASKFDASEAELAVMLPSGKQTRFDNRLRWAKWHLRKAGLIDGPKRGVFAITKRGRELLATGPSRIDMKTLEQYPEFRAFRELDAGDGATGASSTATRDAAAPVASTLTPEERLEAALGEVNAELAANILDLLHKGSPSFFEKVVVDLLQAMGYGGQVVNAGRVVGRTGDGGIDGIIRQDKLGLDLIYIQAKRWGRTVGRPEVQAFAGSLDGVKGKRGVMVTTSTFSADAHGYVEQIEKKIKLIDGAMLAALMIEHGVGVEERTRYVLNRLDGDYFTEE